MYVERQSFKRDRTDGSWEKWDPNLNGYANVFSVVNDDTTGEKLPICGLLGPGTHYLGRAPRPMKILFLGGEAIYLPTNEVVMTALPPFLVGHGNDIAFKCEGPAIFACQYR